jgi:stage V sporulation protein B
VAEKPEQGVSAGRGVLYIAFAKVYFMIAGAVIEFVLPSIMGRYLYGAYGTVAQWVSNINNVMVTGTIQTVSRYTTADPDRADEVKATGVRLHLFVGLPFAILFAALSPVWAWFENDPGKAGPLALSALIVVFYAFYCVFVGSANGTRAFHKQARLDVTFATLRAIGVLGAAALGLGLWGTIGGWAAAAAAILAYAALFVGVPRARAAPIAPMARFLGSIAAYLILVNLIMSVDQLLLKRLASDWFATHGSLSAADAAKEADGQVGYYRAVQNLARLPYQLMIAVTFVIFPLVSRATFERDAEQTRRYIRTTMRYSLIFAGLMGAVLAAKSTAIMTVPPWTPDYAREGGPALAALALGNVAFAIFTIAGTILNGAGRTRESILIAAATLAVLVAGLSIAVPRAHPGREMLLVCGTVSAVAMLLGALASGAALARHFGSFMPAATALRVVLATGATVAIARFLPTAGKAVTVVEAGVCGAVFLVTLVVTGELGRRDLEVIVRRTR